MKCGARIINDGVLILEDLEGELSSMKRKIRKRKKEYCSRPLVPKIRWQRLLRASDESIKCQPDVPGQPGQFYWTTTGQSGGSTPCLAFVSVLFQI